MSLSANTQNVLMAGMNSLNDSECRQIGWSKESGFPTKRQVANLPTTRLLKMQNLGPRTLAEINAWLDDSERPMALEEAIAICKENGFDVVPKEFSEKHYELVAYLAKAATKTRDE